VDRVELIQDLMQIVVDCVDRNCLENGGYEELEQEIDDLLDKYDEVREVVK